MNLTAEQRCIRQWILCMLYNRRENEQPDKFLAIMRDVQATFRDVCQAKKIYVAQYLT